MKICEDVAEEQRKLAEEATKLNKPAPVLPQEACISKVKIFDMIKNEKTQAATYKGTPGLEYLAHDNEKHINTLTSLLSPEDRKKVF